MDAVILAGGFGTRLRDIISDVPKPMAEVSGRPFLEYILDRLAEAKIDRVILSVGYLAEKVISHFGNRYKSIDLIYSREDSPLGTGGAVRQALELTNGDEALVLNGDSYLEIDIADFASRTLGRGEVLMAITQLDNCDRYGKVLLSEERIKGFSKRGDSSSGWINAGCYRLSIAAFEGKELGGQFSLEEDVLVPIAVAGNIQAFPVVGRFIDIGVPEDFMRAGSMINSE